MTTLKNFALSLPVLALAAGLAFGQATMTSTTLSAAVTTTQNYVTVASATGFTANTTMVFIDREAMRVTGVSGTRIRVRRGYQSTRQMAHASGATVYVGPFNYFYQGNPTGPCTSTDEIVLPRVVIDTGDVWQCTNSVWTSITVGSVAASGSGATVLATGATLTSPSIATDVRATTAGGATVGTGALPFSSAYIGNAATNNFRITGTATAGRVMTLPDTAADTFALLAATQTFTNKTLTSPAIGTDVRASSAGGATVGTAALPFSSAYVGNAATNNFQITGTATGARVMTLPDVASDTFALVAATQTLTSKTLTSPSITTDVRASSAGGATVGTAALPFSSAYIGGAATNNFQITGTATGTRLITLPDAAQTVGQRQVTYTQGPTVANAVSTIFFIADRAYTVTRIDAVWGTAEATGDMDVMPEKLTGTTACAAGDDLLSAVIDASTNGGGGTANTVNNGSLHATPTNLAMAAGDRLCMTLTVTPNEIKDLTVTVTLRPS